MDNSITIAKNNILLNNFFPFIRPFYLSKLKFKKQNKNLNLPICTDNFNFFLYLKTAASRIKLKTDAYLICVTCYFNFTPIFYFLKLKMFLSFYTQTHSTFPLSLNFFLSFFNCASDSSRELLVPPFNSFRFPPFYLHPSPNNFPTISFLSYSL